MLKYYNELIYYVQKMVGNKDEASDIIQEAYVKTLEKSQKTTIKNERAFLYKVAKNIVIDETRKQKKISSVDYEYDNFTSPQTEQPEEIAIKDNYYKNLMKIVDTLPKRTKEAFILHVIDGYTRKEIAVMMSITVSAVDKHIVRASKFLQEKIN